MFRKTLLALLLLVILVVPARADSVVKTTIYDDTLGVDVTANPMSFVRTHRYFMQATQQGSNHPSRIDLDRGASSTYWTLVGDGCAFGGTGAGTSSFSGNVQTCIAGSGAYVVSAYIEADAIGTIISASLIARARTPTGNDTITYSMN